MHGTLPPAHFPSGRRPIDKRTQLSGPVGSHCQRIDSGLFLCGHNRVFVLAPTHSPHLGSLLRFTKTSMLPCAPQMIDEGYR